MNRRAFLQISATATLPIALGLFPKSSQGKDYSISVDSNRKFGHLIREAKERTPNEFKEIDVIVIGGGIAGMAAAMKLDQNGLNYLLFESDSKLGGSSAADSWKSAQFATGAHYELAYPQSFGKEMIQELLNMDIIYWDSQVSLYRFQDREYVITEARESQCFVEGKIFPEVIDGVDGINEFNQILNRFKDTMPLPTRLIKKEYHYLNELSFSTFLKNEMELNGELKRRIDYQMVDDWGATSDEVSALAGIHYYMCRPYSEKYVEVFSPPNGNAYFIEKMVGQLSNPSKIAINSLVTSVGTKGSEIQIDVLSDQDKLTRYMAKGVIVAAQKHILPYIFPEAKSYFKNDYAPWVVVNLVCEKSIDFGRWQNDVISENLHFLGFVDANHQHNRSEEYVTLSTYFCFDKDERGKLVEIEEQPELFINETIALIENETDVLIKAAIKHVNIKIMGHAMPIPKPGYLSFSEVPEFNKQIIFAGVDTNRLPLFSEAFDSGLQAAQKLIKNREKDGSAYV